MKRLLLAGLLGLLAVSGAQAQCSGTQAGSVCGTGATPGIAGLTRAPVVGIPGSVLGTFGLAGNTSGLVTIRPQAAAGTYNFNLPISAGTSGQPMLSGGGGASPMTFGTLGLAAGGTGGTTAVTAQTGIGVRENASGTTTFYVRKDGNNNCTGRTDAAGSSGACAFLTVQAGLNAACGLDARRQIIIVQVRGTAVTYTEDLELCSTLGTVNGGTIVLRGDTVTPSNITLAGTTTTVRALGTMSDWLIEGFKFTSSGYCVHAHAAAWVRLGANDFGACTTAHVLADQGGTLEFQFSYTISGSSTFHAIANTQGRVLNIATTITLTGTPAFSGAFIYANGGGKQDWGDGIVFVGTATGSRYAISDGGQLDCDTANPDTYFPGSTAGTLDAGSRIFGNTTRHGRIQLVDGTVALPALTWATDLDSGLYHIGANNIGVAVNGAKVLDIGTAGLGVTGTLSTTGGIVGTTTNDNAGAGKVGEYVESIVTTGSPVSLTTLTAANLTSGLSLTAGDWDTFCNGRFTSAATTVTTQVRVGISTTSATFPSDDVFQQNILHFGSAGATNSSNALNAPPTRMLLSGTTTVFCVVLGQFSTSTLTASGRLYARRVR